MFSMLTNLTKAAVAVAVAPVALIADVATLPASADDIDAGPFDKTAACLKAAGNAFNEAVKPD